MIAATFEVLAEVCAPGFTYRNVGMDETRDDAKRRNVLAQLVEFMGRERPQDRTRPLGHHREPRAGRAAPPSGSMSRAGAEAGASFGSTRRRMTPFSFHQLRDTTPQARLHTAR